MRPFWLKLAALSFHFLSLAVLQESSLRIGKVIQWLAQLPQSKNVVGLIVVKIADPQCVSVHSLQVLSLKMVVCLRVCVCVAGKGEQH